MRTIMTVKNATYRQVLRSQPFGGLPELLLSILAFAHDYAFENLFPNVLSCRLEAVYAGRGP